MRHIRNQKSNIYIIRNLLPPPLKCLIFGLIMTVIIRHTKYD
eukprot:UN18306